MAIIMNVTMNLGRLKAIQVAEVECGPSRRSPTSSSDGIIFSPDCIFCDKTGLKKIKSKGVWTSENVSRLEFGGGKAVHAALQKIFQNLYCRIPGLDLFACAAVYHKSCRRDYLIDQAVGRSKDEELRKQQQELEEAHSSAFSNVRERIDEEVILEKRVVKLTELREMYVSFLSKTSFPNPDYKAEKLRSKIEKCKEYQGIIDFTHSGSNEAAGKLKVV